MAGIRAVLSTLLAAWAPFAMAQTTGLAGLRPRSGWHAILAATQINPERGTLHRAWTYHTGERGRQFETTPMVAGDVMYSLHADSGSSR